MKTIGGYEVVERLGTSVFLVEKKRRRAALKMLPDATAGHLARCFTTACGASALRHPGIARVHDLGVTPESRAFVISELVEGESLASRLAAGPLPLRRALAVARQIARALAASHAQGIAHGSLEPDHVILTGDRVKIINWGVAHLGHDALRAPIYHSPEQCRAAPIFDERSDIYSLGCILFAMLTGHPPFVSARAGQLLMSHLLARPPQLAVQRELRDLVTGMLAKQAEYRPTAAYVVAVLDGMLRDSSPVPALRWLTAVALVASLAFTSAYAARDQLTEKTHAVFHVLAGASLPH